MEVLAIYLRLSIEDEKDIDKDESNSISGQRMLILGFISHDMELRGYEIKEFCDDGYSGTNMDRPGMNLLLEEVKKNKIQCVIVKDMSRFSRDYIELGTYLNQIFPFMGIRFIAIGDHYDSKEHIGNTIEMNTAFKTLLYDLYNKDISVKVKASIENKCANGEFAFGQVPFGYEKSNMKKNAVIVNEREAEIVRYIFSLACDGAGSTQIARLLHEKQIPTARQLRGIKIPEGTKNSTWSSTMVRNILKNRFYLGEMSYGKCTQVSVGSSRKKHVPKEEWHIIQNHHESLVTPEVFAKVSCKTSAHSNARNREKHPLVGKLVCGGCGYSMVYKPARKTDTYRRFECYKHSILKIPECCTCFRADILEETVLFMINKELLVRGKAKEQEKNLSIFQKSKIAILKKELRELHQRQKFTQSSKDILYEEYATGRTTAEEYRKSSDELTEQLTSLSAQIHDMTEEVSCLEEENGKLEADMKQVIRNAQMEGLTFELVGIFIKKICVYKDKRLEIEWNFSETT